MTFATWLCMSRKWSKKISNDSIWSNKTYFWPERSKFNPGSDLIWSASRWDWNRNFDPNAIPIRHAISILEEIKKKLATDFIVDSRGRTFRIGTSLNKRCCQGLADVIARKSFSWWRHKADNWRLVTFLGMVIETAFSVICSQELIYDSSRFEILPIMTS